MFTGIVEELGVLQERIDRGRSARLRIGGRLVPAGLTDGGSVAVNGVCLTVVARRPGSFDADVMGETLARSTLGRIPPGAPVNLERPLTLATPVGGHLVQGHVDATGTVLERRPGDGWQDVTISLPAGYARYVVEKGSICVDGVSLTITALSEQGFTVGLIPATLAATTLGTREVGAQVNLEVDLLAKYVERLLRPRGLG